MVLDLDHCRDPESGALTEWAADLISRAPRSYTEISVSGTGLHVFGAVAPDLPFDDPEAMCQAAVPSPIRRRTTVKLSSR